MSSSVLYDRLRELGDAALIEKTDQDAYTLTETGAALGRALKPLDDWAQSWMEVRAGPARSRVDTTVDPGQS
jgi:DNA-binding HxlR family transcriptional regulator